MDQRLRNQPIGKEYLRGKALQRMNADSDSRLFEKRLRFFEPFFVVFLWVLLFASPLLFGRFEDDIDWTHVFDIWKNHLSLLALFLAHRFVLMPLLFFKGKKVAYFIVTAALILVGAFLIYSFDDKLKRQPIPPPHHGIRPPFNDGPPPKLEGRQPPPDLPGRPARKGRGPIPYYANFLMLSMLLVGFDAGLQTSMRWLGLEQEKSRLQRENVENQLAFLRSQISPHFFMNTLNNIHALVDVDSEEAKESIVKLSNLMRHLLYDSEEKRTYIKNEVQFVKSYIELMRLRFPEKVKIEMDIPSEIPDKSIPPLLFTSILENAFKHGISYTRPSFINVSMSFPGDRLNFKVENSNHPVKTDAPSGIGMENTRKRLDLLYKKEYSLNIHEDKERYIVNLSVPL